MSRNPRIDPIFLLTAKPHPLKALTRDPPLMYWLGTNKWCPSPLCMLHSIWICFFLTFTPFLLPPCLFDSVVRASWCLSFVAWRMCGLLGLYSLPFTPSWTGCCLDKSLHLPAEPMLSFPMTMGLLTVDPAISLHHACYSFTTLFISGYLVGLWVDAPAMLAHFFINLLLRASLTHFPHLYLFWALLANILVVPVHFTTSFLRLSRLIYFFFISFTFLSFFARFFKFPRPNYHIFTSYYFLGLLIFKPT